MCTEILLLIAGLVLIVGGAEALVDGASAIARKLRISEFVIGFTIVGFGTSCPELVVSLTGAIEGNADISLGNVIGSNLFNVLMILGLTALISPISVTETNRKRDMPLMLLVTFLLLFCGMAGNSVSRTEGIVFLILFAFYMYICFKYDKGSNEANGEQTERNIFVAVLLVAGGLAGLVFGGRLFVDNAVNLAHRLGVSDKVIAITLLAGGTSLPELATCVVAATKHKDQLALGNIIGSNIFNILLILGISATVTPLSFASISITDSVAFAASAALLWLCTYTGHKDRIDRWEGFIMLAFFAAYYVILFRN